MNIKSRMKYLIVILTISLSVSFSVYGQSSQSWPQPGATWQYCIYGDYPWFLVWSNTFEYTTDTIFGQHTYAVVQLTEVNDQPLASDGSSWWFPEENMRTFFRQSDDTIYRYVNGQDYVFMVNGIETGEGFSTFRSVEDNWHQWNCSIGLPLEIVSVEQIEINGTFYRQVALSDMDPYFEENEMIHYFVEGIGLLHRYPYLTPEHISSWENPTVGNLADCVGGVSHSPVSYLNHYHDNSVSIDFFQCNTVATNDTDTQKSGIFIYPNPGSDIIFLKGTALNKVTLFDMQGREVWKSELHQNDTSIDVSHLPKGMYLLRATEAGGGVYVNKLVVQ
jgi:hypothetical protein